LDQKNQSHMYNRYQNTYEIIYFVINILNYYNCASKLQITILDYILYDFNDLNINHAIIVRDCTIMIFN